jgi:minichromosome maintenance protein 10
VRLDIEQKQDWFTIAVLAIKSEIKVSKTGSNYQIFTLADLEGAELIVFIFGEAFQELCKLICGAVVAVLNASPLPAKDERRAFKIEKASQVLKLGTSAHYSRCAGIDGINKCEGWVNL